MLADVNSRIRRPPSASNTTPIRPGLSGSAITLTSITRHGFSFGPAATSDLSAVFHKRTSAAAFDLPRDQRLLLFHGRGIPAKILPARLLKGLRLLLVGADAEFEDRPRPVLGGFFWRLFARVGRRRWSLSFFAFAPPPDAG